MLAMCGCRCLGREVAEALASRDHCVIQCFVSDGSSKRALDEACAGAPPLALSARRGESVDATLTSLGGAGRGFSLGGLDCTVAREIREKAYMERVVISREFICADVLSVCGAG